MITSFWLKEIIRLLQLRHWDGQTTHLATGVARPPQTTTLMHASHPHSLFFMCYVLSFKLKLLHAIL
jgi:hypothetical protein